MSVLCVVSRGCLLLPAPLIRIVDELIPPSVEFNWDEIVSRHEVTDILDPINFRFRLAFGFSVSSETSGTKLVNSFMVDFHSSSVHWDQLRDFVFKFHNDGVVASSVVSSGHFIVFELVLLQSRDKLTIVR